MFFPPVSDPMTGIVFFGVFALLFLFLALHIFLIVMNWVLEILIKLVCALIDWIETRWPEAREHRLRVEREAERAKNPRTSRLP